MSAPTVSSAQLRLVPMMPVGPRLSQPHTYHPGICHPVEGSNTRPKRLGTTPCSSSKGTNEWHAFSDASMGNARYPTAFSTSDIASTVSVAPVETALRAPEGPCSALTASRTDPTVATPSTSAASAPGRSSIGLRRNRSTSSRSSPPSPVAAGPATIALVMASNARRRGRCAARSSSSSGDSARSVGSTVTFTPGSDSSSRSSLGEKAACATPRRPTITTRRILLRVRASNACAHMSVSARCCGCLRSIRAQSKATLPRPKITAVVASALLLPTNPCLIGPSRYSTHAGSPLYHPTNSRALYTPFSVCSPGMPSSLSPSAP
mmetsp:Transcript_21271/g.52832  ORF Transcript_21271/g.52832 Transcript_21271/m.52832 type:complete len:321 (-) Transcript_21271:566-1528(-)